MRIKKFITIITLLSLVGLKSLAYDIKVKNEDGVPIRYNFINDSTELEVIGYDHDAWEYYTIIVIPEDVVYKNTTLKVTRIGDRAFYCLGAESFPFPPETISIPNSVVSIGDYAFSGCLLTSITIPNGVNSIGKGLFMSCKKLTSVILPNGVTTIGEEAFRRCSSIISIAFPKSLKNIGNYAFSECGSLTSIFIPDEVVTIGNNAFSDCTGISSVVIGNNVESIGQYAFQGCNVKSSIIIPNSVKTIGLCAFKDVGKVIWLPGTPPEGFPGNAHTNYVPNSLYKTGIIYPHLSSFFEHENILYVPLDISNRTCAAIDVVNSPEVTAVNFKSCVSYKGITMIVKTIEREIASSYEYLEEVTIDYDGNEIPNFGFCKCDNLKKVIIGNNISNIAVCAFYGCISLESLEIPNSVTTIGAQAFYGCKRLSEITISQNVVSVEKSAFKDSGIRNVIIEDGDVELKHGGLIFGSCPIDSVYIGRITSKISSSISHIFEGNSSLRTVCFSPHIEIIPESYFDGCSNLRAINLDNIKRIGKYSFRDCISLNLLTLGAQLTDIGFGSFSGCTAVSKLYCKAVIPPVCESNALTDINKWQCTLYVPTGSKALYQKAEGWKDFFFIEEFGVDTGIDSISNLDSYEDFIIYDMNGVKQEELRKGINILKYKDGHVVKRIIK